MKIRSVVAALGVAAALLGAQPAPAQSTPDLSQQDSHAEFWPDPSHGAQLRLIGQATLPPGLIFQGTTVGSLSGLDWSPFTGRWYAISDDRSTDGGPSRFYTLAIDYDAQAVRGIRVTNVTLLRDRQGKTFGPGAVDPESIRRSPLLGLLYWSSEGDISEGIDPSVNIAAPGGRLLHSFDLPQRFRASRDGKTGPRDNQVFEGLTFSPGGRTVWVSTENSLIQDVAPSPTPGPDPVRIIGFDTLTGRAAAEYVYLTDAPVDGAKFGVTEILSGFGNRLLVLERTFIPGVGNKVRLYLADWKGATNVSRLDSLVGARWRPMTKTLLLDFNALPGVRIDNLEAMSWGPRLSNGNRSLVVMSDDNFNATQITQALVFELRR